MSSGIGTLSIDLVAKLAQFEADMGKAARASEKTAQQIDASLGTIKAGFAALAGAVSVSALVSTFQAIVDGADDLGKLSQRTGIAVETLGGLGYAATLAGGDVHTVTDAADKLNRTLAEAASGEKLASEAFKALGISAKDAAGNTKSVDVAFAEIADKFASYADGPEKVAIAMRLFGKAGAEQIVLLNGGGDAIRRQSEYYQQHSGVTKELTKRSEEFNDTLTNIGLISSSVGTRITAALLPGLQSVATGLLRVQEEGKGFGDVGENIKLVFDAVAKGAASAAYATSVAGYKLQGLVAYVENFFTTDKGRDTRFRAISEMVEADVDRASAQLAKFLQQIDSGLPSRLYDRSAERLKRQSGDPGLPKLRAPGLPSSTSGAEVAKLDSAYQSFISSIRERVAAQEQEIQLGRAATEAEKLRIKFVDELGDKFKSLSVERQVDIDAQIHQLEVGEKLLQQRKRSVEAYQLEVEAQAELAASDVARSKAYEAISVAVSDYGRAVEEETQFLQLQQQLAGRSEQDRAIAIAQYRIQLDLKKRIEEIDRNEGLDASGRAALTARAQAAALQAQQNVIGQAALDSSKALADSIEEGILTGFRNGNSAADLFLRELQAQFAKTVLRPLIQPIAEVGSSLISSGLKSLAASIGIPSFDGGGYTGSGPRSGGLDGKGGQLGIFHPNETVIDHTKGQRGGALTFAPVYQVQIDSRSDRMQVQADMYRLIQKNNAEWHEELRRNYWYS
jgi:hypothetical protein